MQYCSTITVLLWTFSINLISINSKVDIKITKTIEDAMFRFMKLFQINKGMALWSVTPLLLKKNFFKKIEISRGGRVGGGRGRQQLIIFFPGVYSVRIICSILARFWSFLASFSMLWQEPNNCFINFINPGTFKCNSWFIAFLQKETLNISW